jgi:small subunit ribosomal protein S16
MADPPAISLKKDRAVEWLSQGAQPSDAVQRILDRDGILVRTPKFRTSTVVSESTEGTPAPTVTITRVPAPAAVEEPEVSEEAVGEESAEEVVGQAALSDAPEEPVGDEEAVDQAAPSDAPEDAVGEESAEEAVGQAAPSDAPEDETGDEARSE